jgi:hypothetical protein
MNDSADVAGWIDKLAIQELVCTYTSAATRGDWKQFEALWTPDALWEVGEPVGTSFVGPQAIVADLKATLEHQDFFVQMTHDCVVTLLGDGRASGTTTIHALARREGHFEVTNFGIYYDEFVKVDGAWKFAVRRMQPVFLGTSPLPGHTPISRADLSKLNA